MEEGFLRLSRRFFSNEMWKVAREFSECEAWLDLIQSARFDATDEAYSELIGGREISYTRGQYPASISFLMKRWKWSEKKVRYFLSKLKKKGMITTCNQQGMTVITLCNYDDYNPIKDKPKDNGKGIDNNKEINDLKVSMGELRAELRAMSQKMDDKIEDLGQGRGNKKKKDKEILLYCGRLRNTLHNNGLNKGDDKEIMIGNHVFKMKHSEKVYYESYQDIMLLVNEIFDIYAEILKAWNIDKEDR